MRHGSNPPRLAANAILPAFVGRHTKGTSDKLASKRG